MTRRYAKGSPEREAIEAAHIDCGQKCGQIDLDLLAAIDERDQMIERLRGALRDVAQGMHRGALDPFIDAPPTPDPRDRQLAFERAFVEWLQKRARAALSEEADDDPR